MNDSIIFVSKYSLRKGSFIFESGRKLYDGKENAVETVNNLFDILHEQGYSVQIAWYQSYTDFATFVIGDDWTGKFDFLKEEGCEVVYLTRTPDISTTQIKKDLHKK